MWVRFGVFLLVFVGLTGCGGSGSSESSSENSQPSSQNLSLQQSPENLSLSLDFPLDGSLSVSESLSFTGEVAGFSGGSGVEVRVHAGGDTYTSIPVSGAFVVDNVALSPSLSETYQVDLVVGGVVADSVSIQLGYDANRTPFGIGNAMTTDNAGQIYLVDERSVIQVDIATGQRLPILDISAQVEQDVVDILWFEDTERLLLLDGNGDINAYQNTGAGWQWLSETSDLSGDAITLMNDSSGAYIYQAATNLIEQIDQDFNLVAEITLDDHIARVDSAVALNASELLLFGDDSLVVLNLSTVTSTAFSLDSLALGTIGAVNVDSDREQIYVRSAFRNELWRFNLERGAELGLTAELVDLGGATSYAMTFYDEEDALIFSSSNRLSMLDANTGEIDTVSEIAWGSGADWAAPVGVTISQDSQFAYVSDQATDDIYQVDLVTGARVALNANGVPMKAVIGLAQNGSNLYSVDWAQKSVLITEVDSGLTSDLILEDASQTDLSEPISIDLDPNRFRAFVLDRGLRAICEIDTASGDSSILVNSEDASALKLANALSFDQDGQTIYWSSWSDNGLHSLNLNTLQTELISGKDEGTGANFRLPGAIALVANASTAYVSDTFDSRIFSVDLTTGERSVILESGQLSRTDSIAYDETRGALMVLDAGVGALYALNPKSGDLVLVSM